MPWEELLMQTYKIALPLVLGYVIGLLKEKRKKDNANSRGTMLLLRVKLIEYHDTYMERGSIPSYAYQNFEEMYDTYRELGGNGMIVKMHEEVHQLHLKRKEGDNDED